VVCTGFVTDPQRSWVQAANNLVDSISSRGTRATERWADCTAGNSRTHWLDDLGDVGVVGVIGVVVELTVVIDVPSASLGIDEIFNLMCLLDFRRAFSISSGPLEFFVLRMIVSASQTMNRTAHQLILGLEGRCDALWSPNRQRFRIVDVLNRLPPLLPSRKHLLDSVKQHVLVDFVVVLDTTTTGVSLPMGVVGVGFRVGGDSASLPLPLALLGFVRGLRANILLGTRSVVVLNFVLGMSKRTMLAIVTQ
jgi:hypothetical protein